MKQTVFISVHDRKSSSIFRTEFNPEISEAGQILAFLESKHLDSKIFELTKSFEYNPATQFFIPHFHLVEIEKTLKEFKNEIKEKMNAKS